MKTPERLGERLSAFDVGLFWPFGAAREDCGKDLAVAGVADTPARPEVFEKVVDAVTEDSKDQSP